MMLDLCSGTVAHVPVPVHQIRVWFQVSNPLDDASLII